MNLHKTCSVRMIELAAGFIPWLLMQIGLSQERMQKSRILQSVFS